MACIFSRRMPRFPFAVLLAAALSCLPAVPMRAVEIVAHRGASFDAPENTVASAKLAWKQGADAVELDIHLSKDGKLPVSHDPNTKRTAGRDAAIATLTLAELKTLDAGTWKDPKFAGEKIPTLEELLATTPRGKRIFIEIKIGPEIIPALEEALKRTKTTEKNACLISFNFESLKVAKQRIPNFECFYLVNRPNTDPKKKRTPTLDELIADCKAAKLDGLDLNFNWALDEAAVKKIRDAGLKLHVWTVDDPVVAKKWVALGVDGITTNRPGWLREQLAAK
jgi:glycerophosphoryl diester phosphodiesterase